MSLLLCCCCCCCCFVLFFLFSPIPHSLPLPPPPRSLSLFLLLAPFFAQLLALLSLLQLSRYVFQVKNQPYMSTAQRKEVILDHQEKAKNGHPIHVALRARLQEAVRAQGGGTRQKGIKAHSFGSSGGESAHAAAYKHEREMLQKKKKT